MSEKYGAKLTPEGWDLKLAIEADVEPTLVQLTDHMNDQQRQAFRDKLQRYVQKPDRDLILAVRGLQVLGLVCVINQSEFPPGFPAEKMDYLRDFAFGTQLLVHPSVRRRGIGGSLLTHAELWARGQGLAGFWVITHHMADWYKKHFGYQEIGRIDVKGVEKKAMAKKFD